MNKRQKEVVTQQLDSEKAALNALTRQYEQALEGINNRIKLLQADEMTQSRIYQQQYQKALKKQVEDILAKLHTGAYTTLQEYLRAAYTDAFVGTMYDLHGQGVPVIAAINQDAAAKAIITDSKLSEDLYTSLGIDMQALKKAIRNEITRGIASGISYDRMARNIRDVSGTPLSRAKTIARTEGHRIQQASANDARQAAVDNGADVVKQWDATLDGKTRDSHRRMDGEIRETNERFSNGMMYPGDSSGDAAEVINCRCVSLTRARWALDEAELRALEAKATFFKLDKTKDFAEFREKYIKASDAIAQNQRQSIILVGSKYISDKGFVVESQKVHAFMLKDGAKHADDFFNAGYSKDDAEKLLADIEAGFDMSKAVGINKLSGGITKFAIYMELGTIKKKRFLTGWIDEGNGTVTRFVTAYRKD